MSPLPQPDGPALAIEISDGQAHIPGIDRPRLAAIARRALMASAVERAEVSIALVDNETIRAINSRHLGHDFATDVISFTLSDPGDSELSGELIVSAEMAVEMAGRDGIEPFTELVLYVIHGLLHLLGLDDLTPPGAAEMRLREGELLAAEGLSHPFSPRRSEQEREADASVRERTPWRV